jgi:hypothetical protein
MLGAHYNIVTELTIIIHELFVCWMSYLPEQGGSHALGEKFTPVETVVEARPEMNPVLPYKQVSAPTADWRVNINC